MRRKVRRLEQERDLLKRAAAFLPGRPISGECLQDYQGGEGHRVPSLHPCELLRVSRSGFHDWETRSPSDRELSDAWLTEKIREIHIANRGVYGARRIHAELRMAHDIRVGKKRVRD